MADRQVKHDHGVCLLAEVSRIIRSRQVETCLRCDVLGLAAAIGCVIAAAPAELREDLIRDAQDELRAAIARRDNANAVRLPGEAVH